MTDLPPILTSEEAAGLLFCSAKTIEEDCRAGRLPGHKWGEGWAIPRDALLAEVNKIAVERMLERRKQKAPTAIAANDSAGGRRQLPRLPS